MNDLIHKLLFSTDDDNRPINELNIHVYGNTSGTTIFRRAKKLNDNLYITGYTTSEGPSDRDEAIIGRFNLLDQTFYGKVFGGFSNDQFYDLAITQDEYIVTVGVTESTGPGSNKRGMIYKFDQDFNVITSNVIGGFKDDIYYGVTIMPDGTIVAVGSSRSDTNKLFQRCYIVKYTSDLNVIYRKVFGGSRNDELLCVTSDTNGNIYTAGYTSSSGPGSKKRMFVCKLSSALVILNSRIIGGSGDDVFTDISIDNYGNILCSGYTNSDGPGTGTNAVVVIFDSDLNYISGAVLGGNGDIVFNGISVDTSGTVNCVGTSNIDNTSDKGIIVKFNPDLTSIISKYIGGTLDDAFYGIINDISDNSYIVGDTKSGESDLDDVGFIVELPKNLPDVYLHGSIITTMTYDNINLINEVLALNNAVSTYTTTDSYLGNTVSNLTNIISSMTLINDVLV